MPLLNIIYVQGFTKCSWSVPAFAQSGHEVVFGTSTIRIVVNKDTPEEFTINLNHPYYRQRQEHVFANMVHTVPNPPASRKRKIDLELIHRRLGHPSTKPLLAAEEAGCYDDVTIGLRLRARAMIAKSVLFAQQTAVMPRSVRQKSQVPFGFLM